jgi:uncharacterized protein (TIRG00374 family)
MSAAPKVWRVGWRVMLCAALLGWVFHAIFLEEGRLAWEAQGHSWSSLQHADQWRTAWTLGPRELLRRLTDLRPMQGAASLVFMGMTILLGMLRWRMVMRVQGIDLSIGRASEISLVAHFFNALLLGSTGGDLFKAYYAARETHHLKTEAVVTVLVDRLLGLLSMLLFAGIMMLPNLPLLGAHKRLSAVAGAVLLMLAGACLVTGLSFWGGLSKWFPQARSWLRRLPKGEILERSLEACRRFGREPGFLVKSFTLSMLLNLFCVLQIWALADGLALRISPIALLVIVPIVICLAALPITPSGLGVRENLYVWMLAVPELGATPAQALSVSLLAYAGSLVWSAVGGLVYVWFKGRHQLAQVAEEQRTGQP